MIDIIDEAYVLFNFHRALARKWLVVATLRAGYGDIHWLFNFECALTYNIYIYIYKIMEHKYITLSGIREKALGTTQNISWNTKNSPTRKEDTTIITHYHDHGILSTLCNRYGEISIWKQSAKLFLKLTHTLKNRLMVFPTGISHKLSQNTQVRHWGIVVKKRILWNIDVFFYEWVEGKICVVKNWLFLKSNFQYLIGGTV